MKKLSIIICTLLICAATVFGLVACNKDPYIGLKSQLDTLMELNTKKADVAIIDSVMANYYVNTDSTYSDKLQIVEGVVFAKEQYGIAFRKGSAITDKVNTVLAELSANGKMKEIATKYGLEDVIKPIEYKSNWDNIEDKSDWDHVVGNKKITVGYTKFAPIAFDKDNKLVGFDIELSTAVFAKLGIEVKYEKIDWDAKETELEAKKIDCIWNGLTITPEREAEMSISVPYMDNNQVAVIRKADAAKYTDEESMKEARIAVEKGSAGEAAAKKLLGIKDVE